MVETSISQLSTNYNNNAWDDMDSCVKTATLLAVLLCGVALGEAERALEVVDLTANCGVGEFGVGQDVLTNSTCHSLRSFVRRS